MTKVSTVWVVGESPDSYASLCAVARRLGTRVEAIVVSEADVAVAIKDSGADSVLHVEVPRDTLLESSFGVVASAIAERKPDAVLFATSKRMRLAAAYVAATNRTRVVNDAARIWIEEGCVCAEHLVFGGSAYSTEKVKQGVAVILASEGLLTAEPRDDVSVAEATVEELSVSDAGATVTQGCTLLEVKPRTVESVNLVAARHVVSIGRGLAAEADLQLIDDLARVLEAEQGCTRPIAEGVNWMSRERYIGVSGVMLNPDLFVAVGLSGQIQHMVGAAGAKTIVAINKDKNAPIFKQVDYGIVGDLYDVIPKLVAQLSA